MLCYAGKSEFKQETIDLSTALQNTTALLRSSITKDVRLEISLADNLPRINGDLTQIQQVVMNLAINASEASKGGDIVRVATFAINAPDPLLLNSEMSAPLAPGEYVCIEVVDTGCGISKEDIAKIYEPFYSTKIAGRGLGLSVVASIVARHQGVISIDSVQGRGATFRVLLPVAACEMESTPPEIVKNTLDSNQTSPLDIPSSKSILVVDDDVAVRKAMQAILKDSEFDVLTAESGEDAVEMFACHSNDISLILLDLTMPGFTLVETLTGIRAIQNDIPIVIMSGYSEENVSKLLEDWNIAAFLPKPSGDPVRTVRQVLGCTQ